MTRTSSSAAGRDRVAGGATRGITVALVGVDGAGKSTIARRLTEQAPWPCRSLYMGQSLASSTSLLPTSRVVQSATRRSTRTSRRPPSVARQRLRAIAVLGNRVLEGTWRSWLGRRARRRGAVVVYDRYLPFEAAQVRDDPERRHVRALDRFEEWALTHLLGHPDLVIHLDVPAAVARDRKGEGSLRRLERRRRAIVATGAGHGGFVSVDAAQPEDEVLADVIAHIEAVRANRPTPRVAAEGVG